MFLVEFVTFPMSVSFMKFEGNLLKLNTNITAAVINHDKSICSCCYRNKCDHQSYINVRRTNVQSLQHIHSGYNTTVCSYDNHEIYEFIHAKLITALNLILKVLVRNPNDFSLMPKSVYKSSG